MENEKENRHFSYNRDSACTVLTGCGRQSVETETAHTTEEDKLQIGLSFDSFVIERWLRDRDMFVSTAQSLGAEVENVQVAEEKWRNRFSD